MAILKFLEINKHNYKIDSLTKFNIININKNPKINKISLNFGFKGVNFDKKKIIPFFFVLELIAEQKCCITLSRKAILNFNIRKGSVTGCKVTLRKKNMYNFLDTLNIALPRSDNFKGFSKNKLKQNLTNAYSTILKELFIFYQAESELNLDFKRLDFTCNFNSKCFEEKLFLLTYNKLPFN